MVEDVAPGFCFKRSRSAWPLHITLLPWFYINREKLSDFLRGLEQTVQRRQAFEAIIGEEVLFVSSGERDVAVNVLTDHGKITDLHNGLLGLVAAYGGVFHAVPSWYIGDNYTPHITHHQVGEVVHRRHEGDAEVIDGITLVRLHDSQDGQQCEVVGHYKLDRKQPA